MPDDHKYFTIHPDIREQLWVNVRANFVRLAAVVVESRKPRDAKMETLDEAFKLAYQSGLDRGYDMAAEIFDA